MGRRLGRYWMDEEAKTPWGEECIRVAEMYGRWYAEIDFVLRNGRPVVAGLRVTPKPPGRWRLDAVDRFGLSADEAAEMKPNLPSQGLTQTDLRKLNLKQRVSELHALWKALLESEFALNLYAHVPDAPTIHDNPPRKGQILTRAEKAELAQHYLAEPDKRKVNTLLAAAYRAQGYDVSTTDVTNRIRTLRNEGWLTAAPKQGLGGGAPGPELKKWLAAQRRRAKQAQPTQKRQGGKR